MDVTEATADSNNDSSDSPVNESIMNDAVTEQENTMNEPEQTSSKLPTKAEVKLGADTVSKEPTQEELSFMQQLEQREKEFQQEKLKFDTEKLLGKYNLPVNDSIIQHVMKSDVKETENYITELRAIVDECTKQQLDKKLIGKTPPSSRGLVSSFSSYSSNMRDQVKDALK